MRQQENAVKVIVVGAGIIGALTAYRLALQGAEVVVIDAGEPASGASSASFGWINASFYLDESHFALRAAAIDAHRRLHETLRTGATLWQGCLCWEDTGAAFDERYRALKALGYDVREVDAKTFSQLEPEVKAPERALYFAQEGATDLALLTRDALVAAADLGARLVTGLRVTALELRTECVAGIKWAGGTIAADSVVLATGTATEGLLGSLGLTMPMLDRPGLILRSAPLPPLLSHILVSPEQELRQEPSGRLLAPLAAAHQQDDTEEISENPVQLADRASARISAMIGRSVAWERVSLAYRPVPGDGLPVVGSCGPSGLYVSTMHSGATLAPLVAEIAAREVLGQGLSNAQASLIAPYRPQRFTV
jgi:glycine/D-amino acid oxidase-like deaminating enzyme